MGRPDDTADEFIGFIVGLLWVYCASAAGEGGQEPGPAEGALQGALGKGRSGDNQL